MTTRTYQIALGSAAHEVLVKGWLTLNQWTPFDSADVIGVVGTVAVDDDYMYVKTSSGWKRVALSSF
ncbi:hypothetical protein [Microbacterium sp. NPDC055455]